MRKYFIDDLFLEKCNYYYNNYDNCMNNIMYDIYDSIIYESVKYKCREYGNYTLHLNTDGVNPFKVPSQQNYWPFLSFVNEMSPIDRFIVF